MKYFFRHYTPPGQDILLIASGSPEVTRRALQHMVRLFPDGDYHLCTCHPGIPAEDFSSNFHVSDYPTAGQKLSLLLSFRRKRWDILVILCTGEPVMLYWKMMATLLLPAKVLVVNENGDFFWLEWENRSNIRRMLKDRSGVNVEQFFSTLVRALFFPITFLVLVSTAIFLYARRASRLLQWKIRGYSPLESRWETGGSTTGVETPGASSLSSSATEQKEH